MSSRKKSAARKKRVNPRSSRASVGRFKRFARAFVLSLVASFGAASCMLQPQLREQVDLEPILSQLGLSGQAETASLAIESGARVQTRFPECRHFFPNGHPPIVPAGPALRELCFSSFAVLHSGQTKTPVFVAQRLNRQMLIKAQKVRRTERFYAEARLPAAERAELDDYRGSGYSRGHMAAAADMDTPEAMAQSFSLANMVPQNQIQNGGAWSKIEKDTRKYIMRAKGDVYVFTGAAYGDQPETIGAGRVAVPQHLYKAVYDATTGRSWVHWQANSPDTKAGSPLSYEDFVQRTGVRLLQDF
ncbi:DNA/RNA non-specific endonuclease [Parapusillimonas sp. SGNA-6]|nr:DNA/RNA non-specific endonuclease [Parapusillimonas sp. SGNA-6]